MMMKTTLLTIESESNMIQSNPNQALWEKGDFTRIAQTMRTSGEAFIQSLDIRPGDRVLDLGSGDGTTAIPAAKRQAEVLGVDIARNLVEAGNRRAEAHGLANCRFEQGCATDLGHLDDHTFDRVVTVFGAMFAPKPEQVAKEMVRVTRRGGQIVMGNWIPNDPTLVAQILRISSSYSPPPPAGFISPMLWGNPEEVKARFVSAGIPESQISVHTDQWTFEFEGTPEAFVQAFRDYYGPTMNAFEAAQNSGKAEALQAELEALFVSKNISDEAGKTVIPATFLRVIVQA